MKRYKATGWLRLTMYSLTALLKNKELMMCCCIGKCSDAMDRKLTAAGFTHVPNLLVAFLNG